MLADSDIIRFWHYVSANPRLALAAGGLGLFVAVCFFKMIFSDASGFRSTLSLDYHALVQSQWPDFLWGKLKLLFWLALIGGAVTLAFYELPRQFPGFINQPTFKKLVGLPHVYQLASPPKYLGDALAVGDARAALASENFDRLAWEAVADSRTTAPDGQKDLYLVRNSFNPNRGFVVFTNGVHSRIVSVRLDGNQIVCEISVGK